MSIFRTITGLSVTVSLLLSSCQAQKINIIDLSPTKDVNPNALFQLRSVLEQLAGSNLELYENGVVFGMQLPQEFPNGGDFILYDPKNPQFKEQAGTEVYSDIQRHFPDFVQAGNTFWRTDTSYVSDLGDDLDRIAAVETCNQMLLAEWSDEEITQTQLNAIDTVCNTTAASIYMLNLGNSCWERVKHFTTKATYTMPDKKRTYMTENPQNVEALMRVCEAAQGLPNIVTPSP